MAGAFGRALAGSAQGVWPVAHGLPAVQPVVPQRVWENLFKALSDDADFEYILVDSTIVRAHQHSAGAPKKAIDPKIGLKLTRWDGQRAA